MRGEMSTTTTAMTTTLRPQRQRNQSQAERRYGQPAPHNHIIARI
jgi:hypothetical protein